MQLGANRQVTHLLLYSFSLSERSCCAPLFISVCTSFSFSAVLSCVG